MDDDFKAAITAFVVSAFIIGGVIGYAVARLGD
jgi:hypothetical protein